MTLGPVLVAFLAVSLVVLGTMRQAARGSRREIPGFRGALPWVVAGVCGVGAILFATGVPPLVGAGLLTYTAVAVAAVWRMATLDELSRWMLRRQRRARLAISAVALSWLGVVLGLLLGLVNAIATAAY